MRERKSKNTANTKELKQKKNITEKKTSEISDLSGVTDNPLFDLVFYHGPNPIFITDPDGNFLQMNDSATKFFGFSRSQLVKKNIREFFKYTTVSDSDINDQMKQWKLGRKKFILGQYSGGTLCTMDVETESAVFKDMKCIFAFGKSSCKEIINEIDDKFFQSYYMKLSTCVTLHEIGKTISIESRKFFRHDCFVFSVYDSKSDILHTSYGEDTAEGSDAPVEITEYKSSRISEINKQVISGKTILFNRTEDKDDGKFTRFGFKSRLSRSTMLVPITWNDKVIGVASCQSYTPFKYNNDDLKTFHMIVGQCAGAITRVKMEEERKVLNKLIRRLAETLTPHEIGRVMADETRKIFQFDAFSLDFFNPITRVQTGIYAEDTPSGETVPVEVKSNTIIVNDDEIKPVVINSEARKKEAVLISFGFVERKSQSLIFVPIKAKNQTIAVVSVQSYTPNKYDERDLKLLQSFADVCGGALQRSQIHEEAGNQLRRIATLNEVAKLSMNIDDPAQLIRAILNTLRKTMTVDAFSFVDYDPVNKQFVELLQADIIDGEFRVWEVNKVHSIKNNPLVKVVQRGKPILELREPKKEFKTMLVPFGNKDKLSGSLMFAPITLKSDVKGVISVQTYRYFAYNEKDLELLVDVANVLGVAMSKIHAERALKKSEDIYRKAIRYARGVPYQLDYRSKKYIYMDEGIYDLIGYRPEELDQDKFSALIVEMILRGEIENVPPEEAVEKVHKEIYSKWETDIRIVDKSGKEKWISDLSICVKDVEGSVIGSFGILQDITDRKKMEENLLNATRLDATATLAAGVAHDFNNLMVGVLGNSELLRMDFHDNEDAMKIIDKVSNAAQKAGELAQQLLAFARGGKYQPQVMNLNHTIKDMLNLQRGSFPERIEFERHLDSDLANIKADPAQMHQVFMNLCINAVEAIDRIGFITISTENITIERKMPEKFGDLKPGKYVCMSVKDTGSGIDKKNLSTIFTPFFSTKSTGRGLGLSAVYGIVKNHEGYIHVESKKGIGTEFKVYFPAVDEKIKKTKSTKPLDSKSGSETILIIDDDEIIQEIMEQILTRLGYKLLFASNGKEAVNIARVHEGEIHIAILDMGMPVMGGSQAYPLLKELRPDMQVIICSGYELDGPAQVLLDAGAFSFIHKPFRAEHLASEIRRAIETRNASSL